MLCFSLRTSTYDEILLAFKVIIVFDGDYFSSLIEILIGANQFFLHSQFSNFFSWLLKSVKMLMSEPSDQLLPFSRFGFYFVSIFLFPGNSKFFLCPLPFLIIIIFLLTVNLLSYSWSSYTIKILLNSYLSLLKLIIVSKLTCKLASTLGFRMSNKFIYDLVIFV